MNKSNLLRLFCLEGLFLDKIKINEEFKTVFLHVRSPRTKAFCPVCSLATKKVHKCYVRKIKHGIFNEKIIVLIVKFRYFRCKKCFKIFREELSGIDERRTSEYFRQSIIPKVKNRSFRDVAKEHRISTMSLMRIVVSLMNLSSIIWSNKPFFLGIDEHSFSGHDLMITITDLTNHRVLAILKDDHNATLRSFLRKIPLNIRQNIIGVCIDMRRSYFNLVKEELNKNVIIDKFHVIQYFNWHLDCLRQVYTSNHYPLPKKLLEKNQEDLDEKEKRIIVKIIKKYPPIGELWRLKEFVRRFYLIKDKNKAEQTFKVMLSGLEFDPRTRWQAIYKTLKRWQQEILNYFTFRITNAYTEGVHTRIKLLKRISYGFRNKTNYIAKMTLAFMPIVTLLTMISHHQV